MTAPGQEPDEVMTGKPGGEHHEGRREHEVDTPNLDDIGDNHMPEDVREDVRKATSRDESSAVESATDLGDDPVEPGSAGS